MTPQRSWTDRLLPDWLGGSSEPTGRGVPDDGSGPEHRRLLARIAQQREGLEDALAALPEEAAGTSRRIREAADGLVTRARSAADSLEEDGGAGDEEAVAALRRGARALHEAHYLAIMMRVARDHGDDASADEARDGLPSSLEELEAAASDLDSSLGRREAG